MDRITSLDDVARGLDALIAADPRLVAIRTAAGEVPLRLNEPGFASLASIVVSQQVSTASARAIFGRLSALHDPLTPESILAGGEPVMRQAGLSGPKIRTLLAVASAVQSGLDLDELCRLDAGESMKRLTALPGIGPWTAEIYLLFCAGHPDIFPARDIALQASVGHALGMEGRPDAEKVAAIAESWTPWRGVAARLFWAYYRVLRGRDAVPVVANP
jgi:DNA-3-methyladenine glycosylase II